MDNNKQERDLRSEDTTPVGAPTNDKATAIGLLHVPPETTSSIFAKDFNMNSYDYGNSEGITTNQHADIPDIASPVVQFSDVASARTAVYAAGSPYISPENLSTSPVPAMTTRRTQMRPGGPTSNPGETYFSPLHPHHPPRSKSSMSNTATPLTSVSTQTSPSSLKSSSEDNDLSLQGSNTLNRTTSVRTNKDTASKLRRISHSKSNSTSTTNLARSGDNASPPTLSSLRTDFPASRLTFMRTRSSNPSQTSIHADAIGPTINTRIEAKTVGNTPISSPRWHAQRPSRSAEGSFDDFSLNGTPSGTPSLHPHYHKMPPKETVRVDVEHDTFTGNKLINQYEILKEIGRGEHGKVKLGRDCETSAMVAIKIVPRFSARRRLGRLGQPEDFVKKEVAILKKARHPNVVALLEVIDDPSKNKVYIVLEHAERGEIQWRKKGLHEINIVNRKRRERELQGIEEDENTRQYDQHIMHNAQKSRRHLKYRPQMAQKANTMNFGHYDLDEEDDGDDYVGYELSHTQSLNSRAGDTYDDASPNAYRDRAGSLAESSVSHVSSQFETIADDDEHNYVPTFSIGEAREALRDTILGLEFLHFQGIIHRDIKPANLLRAADGHIKISDFGVSYFGKVPALDEDGTEPNENDLRDNPRELARTVGTPAFYAPELCSFDETIFSEVNEDGTPKISDAIDIWALGVTLYGLIYGYLPFLPSGTQSWFQFTRETKPFIPKTRLASIELPPTSPITQDPFEDERRREDELKIETVPTTLRDLLRQMLTLDPARRITIEQIKNHPWVLEDIDNPDKWVVDTKPEAEGRPVVSEQINAKDMSHAIVKRTAFEKFQAGLIGMASKIAGLGVSRKRTTSNATTASASAESIPSLSGSSNSTIGKEQQMREGRTEEVVVAALKASREGEHPLAQSQTASPVQEEGSYFPADAEVNTSSYSTGTTPLADDERRPRGPDRMYSDISTAETVRASNHLTQISGYLEPVIQEPETPTNLERSPKGLFNSSLLHSVSKRLNVTKNQERKSAAERSPSASASSDRLSRSSMDSNPRSGPSTILSKIAAAPVAIDTPEQLRDEARSTERPTSDTGMHRSAPPATRYYQPEVSSDAAFEQAQAINYHKNVREMEDAAERAATRPHSSPSNLECPPSPDDAIFKHSSREAGVGKSSPMQQLSSTSTISSTAGLLSRGTSDPSFPSVISEASSLSATSYLSSPQTWLPLKDGSGDTLQPEHMRTNETVIEYEKPMATVGGSLEAQQAAMQEVAEDEEDDSDDSDNALSFGDKTKKSAKVAS